MELDPQQLIYDWNTAGGTQPPVPRRVLLYDETLRDGIQSPSVVDPDIEDKIRLLHLMDAIGVDVVDIGLPGAGPRAVADVTRLAEEIRDSRLSIKASCAARTVVRDIQPVVEISQKVGIPIEVMAFIGSSPIRQYAENWELEDILRHSSQALRFAVENGLETTYVTEDTIRSHPASLKRLFENAIECGATKLCLCDTVGHATPDGVAHLISFTRHLIAGMGVDVKIDWHGHNDRGLALANTLRAVEAGVDRIHGCAVGIGERVGNAAMDQLLMNLKLLGLFEGDLSRLVEYCQVASRATQVPIPPNYPLAGKDAFRTGTGVHAAAIIKAEKKGHQWLADRIYSGVPAGMFGLKQGIEVGHMSGESNVVYWLRSRSIEPAPALVQQIFQLAKRSDRNLEDSEILEAVAAYQG